MTQVTRAVGEPESRAPPGGGAAASPALRYLRNLAITGVWAPLLFLSLWLGASAIVGSLSPPGSALAAKAGGFFVYGLFFFGFAAAHLLLASSLVGLGLLAFRKASRPLATGVSSLVGAGLAVAVLLPVYLGVKVL